MDEKAQLEALEKEKERKIRDYMDLQDQADAVNERIYRLCCDIETLNCRIRKTQEEVEKAERKAAARNIETPPPSNGTSAQ